MSSLIFDSVDMEADIISSEHTFIDVNGRIMRDDPSHPLRFAVLRESIIREDGFVHPDLGLLVPAPSGATRGLGMVRDTYNSCQTRCFPGVPSDSVSKKVRENHAIKGNSTIKDALNAQMAQDKKFSQTEILLKVPLSMQMTRSLALKTLLPLIPAGVNSRVPLQELDDAGLLVLLLAHERGMFLYSSYIIFSHSYLKIHHSDRVRKGIQIFTLHINITSQSQLWLLTTNAVRSSRGYFNHES